MSIETGTQHEHSEQEASIKEVENRSSDWTKDIVAKVSQHARPAVVALAKSAAEYTIGVNDISLAYARAAFGIVAEKLKEQKNERQGN